MWGLPGICHPDRDGAGNPAVSEEIRGFASPPRDGFAVYERCVGTFTINNNADMAKM